MTCGNVCSIDPSPPSAHVSPFTRAAIRAVAMSNSSGVARHGPSDVAKSFPSPGPRPTCISRNWMSRALQSLTTV